MSRKVRVQLNYFLTMLLGLLGITSCQRVMYGPEPMYGPEVMYGIPVEDYWDSPISVRDQSTNDWNAVADKTSIAVTSPGNSRWQALELLKVYADRQYINVCCEINDSILKEPDVKTFRIYLNADGDDKTGGGADLYADGNAEVLLDGLICAGEGLDDYNPAVYQWFGGEGGGMTDQTDPAGPHWTDPSVTPTPENNWGAIVGAGQQPIGRSQLVGNRLEIQLNRMLIPFAFADTFSIGVELQHQWMTVGVLPNAADDEAGNPVLAEKMVVSIDRE